MRWGSPTATPPFEPLGLAPALKSTSRMRSSILGIYHPGGVFHPSATNIGQFGKLTDHTGEESRSLSLPKGPFAKPYIYTVAHASGSECSVFFVANASALSSFRVSASDFSVFFRVNPWQMLMPLLVLNSVSRA